MSAVATAADAASNLKDGFSGCKNRICNQKFKLDARNNGWTKKEAKIFRRNSVISRILHWLDWNRLLLSKDIYYIHIYYVKRKFSNGHTVTACTIGICIWVRACPLRSLATPKVTFISTPTPLRLAYPQQTP